jgi:hypothetical protein
MDRNVKRWYARCADDLHIPLFENNPGPKNLCIGCGGIRELHAIGEGFVSSQEADKGRADSLPSSKPTAPLLIKRF